MAHVVAALVTDGANAFEFAVACEVFGIPRPELGVEWYEFRLCTLEGGALLAGGAKLHGTHGLEAVAGADTVIVPHGPVEGLPDPRVLEALRDAHARGARLISYCSGAFTLAAAGLLDGLRATTHWMYTESFQRRFPTVRLDPNVLFVDEGQVLTSAGTAAGIDLSLHVVRRDHGADVARAVARRMVVAPHREGGQAQFVRPEHQPRVEADTLAPLLDWLAENLHRDVPVAEMAARVAMSERSFARRFKEATGTTPFRWVLAQRLRHAQALLESTDADVERIARAAGFGTAANMRAHFGRDLATSPSAYRRAFRGAAGPTGSPGRRAVARRLI